MQAESMYRAVVRATDNVSPIFVVSFCRHSKGTPAFEHGLLSQWRGYAASGGFALEFDEEKLDSLLQHELGQYAYVMAKSDDVRYHDYNELFDASVYKGVAGEMIRDLFSDRGIDTSEVTGRKDIDGVVQKYITTAPYVKHWGFHEEREYRIIAPCIRSNSMPEGEKRPAKAIKFRARSDLMVPYVELFESANQSFPIKSIIVGPHPYQEKQAEAVRMALESVPPSVYLLFHIGGEHPQHGRRSIPTSPGNQLPRKVRKLLDGARERPFPFIPTCCGTPAGSSSPTTAMTHARHSGLSRPPIDHVHGPLYGFDAQSVQELLEGLTSSLHSSRSVRQVVLPSPRCSVGAERDLLSSVRRARPRVKTSQQDGENAG
jgi:hypothetical protein